MRVAVIGGGAAGFFAAIHVRENFPESEVHLFEKSDKVLAKVKISGGGRCNVTNGTTSIKDLVSAYPRGGKALKKSFQIFNTSHVRAWFEDRNVKLKVEADNRVFPISDDSQSIITCLIQEIQRLKVIVHYKTKVTKIIPSNDNISLCLKGTAQPIQFDKVIIACGGSPKRDGLLWLEELGHRIEDPVPSLFTFNMPNEPILSLMGVVAPNVLASIQGHKLKTTGPLLLTHWGMSGPAILKLSAFGARMLADCKYAFDAQINWTGIQSNDVVRDTIQNVIKEHPKKKVVNVNLFDLSDRLWRFLLDKSHIPETYKYNDLTKKHLDKLINTLTHDHYPVRGKTTFKEEFVTCGGVSLDSIDMKTMESKACPNLFFAGEIMDIDGITGGYNFQAAWTTSFIAAKLGS